MINILITGCNGFIGQSAVQYFKTLGYNIYETNRQTLNVENATQVKQFFASNRVDYVIHGAIKGGRRHQEDNYHDFVTNITMFKNLLEHSGQYKLMFSFGSGAEFDRRMDISSINELELFNRQPEDYYGLAKNIIAREIAKHNDNVINLRLFGCFGYLEDNTRFIKNSLISALKGEQVTIHQNKKMDFFYIEDLWQVIKFYIENYKKTLPKDINMCYSEKASLLEIAFQINMLTNSNRQVIIKEKDNCKPYTGSSQRLANLGIELCGLNAGIQKVFKTLKEV